VEMVQLPGMALVDSPSLTGIQKCWKDDGLVDIELCGQAYTSTFPDSWAKSSESCTGFGYPSVGFIIDVDTVRQSATQVCKLVYSCEGLTLHCHYRN